MFFMHPGRGHRQCFFFVPRKPFFLAKKKFPRFLVPLVPTVFWGRMPMMEKPRREFFRDLPSINRYFPIENWIPDARNHLKNRLPRFVKLMISVIIVFYLFVSYFSPPGLILVPPVFNTK